MFIRPEPKLPISIVAEFLGITKQALHKQLANKGLKAPILGNKAYINHTIARQLFNISFKKTVIAGEIVKGGTGKTTTIDHISCCSNAFGAKVLVIDTDPQGNLTDLYNIDPDEHPALIDILKDQIPIQDAIINVSPGLDILPSRIENVVIDSTIVYDHLDIRNFYNNILEDVINDYDFIFIDCPPTLSQAVTATSLFADVIIAPLNPDKFSSKGLDILKSEIIKLRKNFKKNIDFKVFLNKFSNKTILSGKTVMTLLSDPGLEEHILSTSIQYSQEIPNLASQNKNVFLNLKKSAIRDDFCLLTLELLNFSKDDVFKNHEAITDTESTAELTV